MKKVFIYILLLSFGISNDIYKQIRIDNISQDDISLFRYSGIDIDHADYQSGQYIEFAISEHDLSILDALGYEYHIIHEDLQVFYVQELVSISCDMNCEILNCSHLEMVWKMTLNMLIS